MNVSEGGSTKENVDPRESPKLSNSKRRKSPSKTPLFAKLQNLEALFEHGFVTQEEYEERRRQLIDLITGTHGDASLPSPSSRNRESGGSEQHRTTSIWDQEYVSDGFTSSSDANESLFHNDVHQNSKPRTLRKVVVPGGPPDFSKIQTESAIKHTFDLKTRTWSSARIRVCLDDTPFAKGGLRLVYHLLELPDLQQTEINPNSVKHTKQNSHTSQISDGRNQQADNGSKNRSLWNDEAMSSKLNKAVDGTVTSTSSVKEATANPAPVYIATQAYTSNLGGCSTGLTELRTVSQVDAQEQHVGNPASKGQIGKGELTSYVGKIAIDVGETPDTYFRDVEMQAHCAYYARLFNSYNPPRRVQFCKAWVVELVEREGSPLCAVEKYISGSYRKHNNNFGFVSDDERNTPQAFSHFSYEASSHSMVIIDIQGVGDHYTDPQIHTITGNDFGKGNLGRKGCAKFLSTHRCNGICRYLKLPSVNPRYDLEGTIPALPYMDTDNILKHKFQEIHYYESNPSLQRYISSHTQHQTDSQRRDTAPTWILGDTTGNFHHTERTDERCSVLSCSIL